MAEEFAESRSEAPTQRRREEAREQGQVAVSTELTAGLLLLAGVGGLWLEAQALGAGLLETVRFRFLELRADGFDLEQCRRVLVWLAIRGAGLIAVFLGMMFAVSLGTGTMQSGFHMVPELLVPRWEKLSPAEGWKRLFSLASGVRGLVAILKVTLIACVAGWVLHGRIREIEALQQGTLSGATVTAWNLALRLAFAIAASLVVVGVADYLFQRWRLEMRLRMTRQELKEEIKREEGDPQIRARIRRMQREMSKKRMMQDVPRATLVITNPTHLAVALRYERGSMPAPRVVAKGAGHLAERIVALARQHAVPVVERKPVAQALFKAVKVGQDIPAALYYAVAEVLAYVYRLRGVA
jgi:flagellar biosynthetic protein FlhB